MGRAFRVGCGYAAKAGRRCWLASQPRPSRPLRAFDPHIGSRVALELEHALEHGVDVELRATREDHRLAWTEGAVRPRVTRGTLEVLDACRRLRHQHVVGERRDALVAVPLQAPV